jgi:tRNA dimethylallyltransferase
MSKALIICGPTATGKTALALKLATKLKGELVCADSRQVYQGMDITTGKDIPPHFSKVTSSVTWSRGSLDYYTDSTTRIWLTDVVSPKEEFNVSFWHECAAAVVANIHARNKLPIIVGVTGLYIKSLTTVLPTISIPSSPDLRKQLESKSVEELFNKLNKLDPIKASSLNSSDKANPRRLIRAIEIATFLISNPSPKVIKRRESEVLAIGLTLPRPQAYSRIDQRVLDRISQGAESEVRSLLSSGFTWDLPSMRTSGYAVWQDYLEHQSDLPTLILRWQQAEHRDFRHQLTWFSKQPSVHWFDVTTPNWESLANHLVDSWYNNP